MHARTRTVLTPCPRLQESRWAHIQNTAAKKTLLLGTIKMATLNLFQIVSKQLKETTDVDVTLEDTHKQLDKVRGGASVPPAGFPEPRWGPSWLSGGMNLTEQGFSNFNSIRLTWD